MAETPRAEVGETCHLLGRNGGGAIWPWIPSTSLPLSPALPGDAWHRDFRRVRSPTGEVKACMAVQGGAWETQRPARPQAQSAQSGEGLDVF